MLIGLCATLVAPASAQGLSDIHPSVFLAGIFVLACFVGYYVVWAVTPALHTPLMSVTNAISAVVVVGAIIAAAATGIGASEASETGDIWIARSLGAGAVFLASINIFGGFLITRRMLAMYKTKS
ncbi:MAG: proton-translocating transhydrogenase family protein [Pseudomonadota bacterium]